MALLETCFCCSLLVASGLAGVYSLVAYIVAFTIELWWILEAEATLPTPAYVLCAGYFFVFICSAALLHGLTVKRTLYLLGWLFMVAVFTFPEAGLVLFMTFHFWNIKSLHGLTEFVCWLCRLVCNSKVSGLVCVQSLYSMWHEEKTVLQRLQALNMVPVVPERSDVSNLHPTNGLRQHSAGHINAGFVGSMEQFVIQNPEQIRRSVRRMSQFDLHNGSQLVPHYPTRNPVLLGGNEFNAATFSGMLATQFLTPRPVRSQSMMDLRSTGLPQNYSTQSLDRRMLRYHMPLELRRAGSMDQLNNSRPVAGFYRGEVGRHYNMLQAGNNLRPKMVNSHMSLSESDDQQQYRDVAL